MKWKIVYVDEAPKMTEGFNEDFGMYIGSEFKLISGYGKALDLNSNRIVIKDQSDSKTQLFKFDGKTRTIKVKGYSTEWSHSLDMRNQWMYVYGTGSQWHQLFKYNRKTRQLYNQRGKVLDVKDSDKNGAYVGTADPQEGRTQQTFRIMYSDGRMEPGMSSGKRTVTTHTHTIPGEVTTKMVPGEVVTRRISGTGPPPPGFKGKVTRTMKRVPGKRRRKGKKSI